MILKPYGHWPCAFVGTFLFLRGDTSTPVSRHPSATESDFWCSAVATEEKATKAEEKERKEREKKRHSCRRKTQTANRSQVAVHIKRLGISCALAKSLCPGNPPAWGPRKHRRRPRPKHQPFSFLAPSITLRRPSCPVA